MLLYEIAIIGIIAVIEISGQLNHKHLIRIESIFYKPADRIGDPSKDHGPYITIDLSWRRAG